MTAPARPSDARKWLFAVALVLAIAATWGVLALQPRAALETSVMSLHNTLERGRALARATNTEQQLEYVFASSDGGPAWQLRGGDSQPSGPQEGVELQSLRLEGKSTRRGRCTVPIAADGSLAPHEVVLLQREPGWDQRTTLSIAADGSIARSSWRRRRTSSPQPEEPPEVDLRPAPGDSD